MVERQVLEAAQRDLNRAGPRLRLRNEGHNEVGVEVVEDGRTRLFFTFRATRRATRREIERRAVAGLHRLLQAPSAGYRREAG